MSWLHSWVFWLALSCVVGVAIGAFLLVRSIVRPVIARSLKNYGTPQDHGLRAEALTLEDGTYGWCAHATDADASLAILLVHGRSRSSGWMYPLASRLWPHATVMAIDLPGHGKSPWAFVSYGVRESETVHHAIEWLRAHDTKKIVVVGVSMGGASSILALAHHPCAQVCGLATIGAYSDITRVFRQISVHLHLPWVISRWIFALAAKIGGFSLSRHRPIDVMDQIEVPYLALQGKNDALVPLVCARLLSDAAVCSASSYVYYDGPHDQPDNADLWRVLDAFLRGREAALHVVDHVEHQAQQATD